MDARTGTVQTRVAAPYAVFTAIQSEKRILVVSDKAGRQYTLPGGRGTREETFAQAALRKVREETGIPFSPALIAQIAFRMNGKIGRQQPQYLFSIPVQDSFLDCVREEGPCGHKLMVIERQRLSASALPEHITALIMSAQR